MRRLHRQARHRDVRWAVDDPLIVTTTIYSRWELSPVVVS
jgi:hypothetical protein